MKSPAEAQRARTLALLQRTHAARVLVEEERTDPHVALSYVVWPTVKLERLSEADKRPPGRTWGRRRDP